MKNPGQSMGNQMVVNKRETSIVLAVTAANCLRYTSTHRIRCPRIRTCLPGATRVNTSQ